MEHFTINNILEKRQLNRCPLPLWKLRVSDTEYKQLKATLKKHWLQRNPNALYDREATLYFAEWWRREYAGDTADTTPSRKLIAGSLGIPDYQANDFYDAAKRGLQKLGITPIRSHQGHTYNFRTLLSQGGLPIRYIQNNEFSSYKRFLLQLAKEAKEIEMDWEDTEYISHLPAADYLPQTFKNENIFYLSLQIIRAISEERPDLLPYEADTDELKDLTQLIKKEYSNQRSHSFLTINWQLKIIPGRESFLSFSVEYPRKIKIQEIDELIKTEGIQFFSIFVDNIHVISYRRASSDNEYYYSTGTVHPRTFNWEGQQIVNIQLKTDCGIVHDIVLPAAYAPDMDIPQLFSLENNQWLLKRIGKKSQDCAILANNDWRTDEDTPGQPLRIESNEYNFYPLKDSLKLIRKETGDELTFKNQTAQYYVEFRIDSPAWLEKASYKLITQTPGVRVFGPDDEIVSKKYYTVTYRPYKSREWQPFLAGNLPNGLLEFKVNFPDGSFHIEKFYHQKHLHCEHLFQEGQQGEIKWHLTGGKVYPLSCEAFTYTGKGGNVFEVNRTQYHTYEDYWCGFRIQAEDGSVLNLFVLPPFKSILVTHSGGEVDSQDEIISLDMLYKYKVVVSGFDQTETEIDYLDNQNPQPVKLHADIRQGIHPLSIFREHIEQLFLLYGFNTFSRNSSVRLTFGTGRFRKEIYVRRFNQDTRMKEGKVYVYNQESEQNETPDPVEYNGKLLFIPIAGSKSHIEEYNLIHDGEGYTIPPGVPCRQGIIFSDYLDDNKIIPKFYDFDRKDDIEIEERKESAKDSILLLVEELTNNPFFAEEWQQVIQSFDIATQHALPFRTFNCFKAIARSPHLMIRLLVLLKLDDAGNPNRIPELVRFEREFAVAWHWIKSDIWNEEVSYFTVSGYPFPFEKYIEAQHEILEESLMTNLSDLKKYVYQEEKVPTAPQMLRQEIRDKRSLIAGKSDKNADLPATHIRTESKYFNIDGATGYQTTCLLAPAKAAENLMGINDDLWKYDKESKKLRRIINFYRIIFPNIYGDILLHTIKHINYNN